ncbi:MAG TPA: ThuA domain-containing protein [Xanthomonadales bacterium]|nr:ThuA domain-containing protein [Xanthomonadales bacterium]
MSSTHPGSEQVHLVCGGKYHDFDFARLELLGLLAEIPQVRTSVAGDWSDIDSLSSASVLISYTSDLVPGENEQDQLEGFLRRGGSWFALHGTNSLLQYTRGVGWEAPHQATRFFEMLGSQFVAHPPIQPYTVRPSCQHPLVEGIEPFTADDELYLCRFFGEHTCLLETDFSGETPGFAESDWADNDKVPVMYLHPWETNEVLYLNLGHARGHWDMQPLMDYYDTEERGSWKRPEFYELLRRGIQWALNRTTRAAGFEQ